MNTPRMIPFSSTLSPYTTALSGPNIVKRPGSMLVRSASRRASAPMRSTFCIDCGPISIATQATSIVSGTSNIAIGR